MKKIFSVLLCILTISGTISAQTEFTGRWVISTNTSSTDQALELMFNLDGISQQQTINTNATTNEERMLAAGVYSKSYDKKYHLLDNKLSWNNGNIDQFINWGAATTLKYNNQQVTLIPEHQDENFVIYSTYQSPGTSERDLLIQRIYENGGMPAYDLNHIILTTDYNPTPIHRLPFDFAITEEIDDERSIFVVANNATVHGGTNYGSSILKFIIDENGVSPTSCEQVLPITGTPFNTLDFAAYTLEIKHISGDDYWFAWTSEDDDYCDRVLVSDGDNSGSNNFIFDLNLGRIGGIEYSNLYPGYMYVSTSNSGIIKLDLNSYGNITYTNISDINEFNHTDLQKGPDGNIYAVNNDGNTLGQISEQDGTFDPTYYPIKVNGTERNLNTYRNFGPYPGINYYKLPKNDRTYIPITAEADLTHVICPGDETGEAFVEVTAGDGYPFTFIWKNEKGQTITNHITNTETTSHITHLSEGIYTCKITDVNGYKETLEVEILVTNAIYDELELVDITSDMSNQEISYLKGFDIPGGNLVTLTNCTLKFGPDAKLRVKKNAKLVLNNCILTHEDACGNYLWQGIEVEGDKTLSQYPTIGSDNQGRVDLNDCTIKNAVRGINLWIPGNLNSTGGIAKAINSSFINNVLSVRFMPYRNMLGVKEVDNLSLFKECNFVVNNQNFFYTNNDMQSQRAFHYELRELVSLCQVKGIPFKACSFVNNATIDIYDYNKGITSSDAGFKIEPLCTSMSTPCPDYDSCYFYGFYRAISTYTNLIGGLYAYSVNMASFQNNMYGVYDDGVNNATIINSTFGIGENTVDAATCPEPFGNGIYMKENSDITIENNVFGKYPSAPANTKTRGILLDRAQIVLDIIYRNTLNGLTIGNHTIGNCRYRNDDNCGPRYLCNNNYNNTNDFWVANYNPDTTIKDAKIYTNQGEFNKPSRNTFSSTADYHIINEGKAKINYYYYQPNYLTEKPDTTNRCYDNRYIDIMHTNYTNQCTDNFGGGSGGGILLSDAGKQQEESNYANALSNYQSVESIYENYKDGGSTPQELMDVEAAQPNDMWALRAQLLGHSPHLSQEVLIKTSDRTDVFPESVLFDILAANPDELKKKELLDYLEEKEDPLPNYMIALLRDIAKDTTYKTSLLRHMRNHSSDYYAAAQNIIRSLLYADTLDFQELRNWYDNKGGLNSDYHIARTYLHEGDYSSAISLLDMLPALYEIEGEGLIEHNNYKQMIEMRHNWDLAGIEEFQLDSLRIDTLANIADTARGMAGAMARGLLEFAYGYHFPNCIACGNQNKDRKLGNSQTTGNKPAKIQLSVSPNPANTWVRFKYELKNQAVIVVHNNSGQSVAEIALDPGKKEYVWDTRALASGLYYYIMEANGQISSGSFIINH